MSYQLQHTRLEEILCCPACKGDLSFAKSTSKCESCEREYPIVDGKYYFVPVPSSAEPLGIMDRLRTAIKRWPALYRSTVRVLSPVMPADYYKRVLADRDGIFINIGSGNRSLGKNVIDVDMSDYPNVSVVADIQELPFKEASIDGVLSIAVLEHVREPKQVIEECHRVLREGGFVFTVVAFMQPFHAAPADYQRYTKPGLEYLHRQFERVESGTYGGPVSGFLWILQEFVALLLSFGIRPLRDLLSMVLMLLTWPIKLLDLLFRHSPLSESIASTVFFHGRKMAQLHGNNLASASSPNPK